MHDATSVHYMANITISSVVLGISLGVTGTQVILDSGTARASSAGYLNKPLTLYLSIRDKKNSSSTGHLLPHRFVGYPNPTSLCLFPQGAEEDYSCCARA
jgi:hypothetical protein